MLASGNHFLPFFQTAVKMEENGFHQPDNQFSLVKIWYFFKNWPPIITVTVSADQNEGFLEKCNFTGSKSNFHSSQYLKKIEENGFL